MSEEQNLLAELLKSAIDMVYEEDRPLLNFNEEDRKGLEQAFVFRVGIHLSNLLKGTEYEVLDLDSEYNKNHGVTKTSVNFPNGMRPDLLIHQRDTHNQNKLAVEFKGHWENNIQSDLNKLKDLTSSNEDYQYLLGVFVHIGRTEASFRNFINGIENE